MIELFAYGTLRDPEYQRELFGHELRMRAATLPNWMPVVAESGYLTVVPREGVDVDGDLLELDGDDMAIADGWEEVPHYTRMIVEVRAAGGSPVSAWLYVRPTDSREPAPEGMLARKNRDEVLAAIRAFRAIPE
jgi:gamma-glutamylcyclotransferase (GGCT)/AIG2-like uncharacterized protein YtfP